MKYNESFYVSKPEIILSESSESIKTYESVYVSNHETKSNILCSDIIANYTSYNEGAYECNNGYTCLQSHNVNCTTNYYVYGLEPTIYAFLVDDYINGI